MDHAIFSGLAGGLVATLILGWMASNARRVEADREGWSTITPGLAVWTPLAASAAFSLCLLYIYLFVGSARPDADNQMRICLGLAAAFAGGSLLLAWSAFSRTVSWRAGELRVRRFFGRTVTQSIADLVGADYRAGAAVFRLSFRDGYVVHVSPYMRGTRQLLEHLGHSGNDEAVRI